MVLERIHLEEVEILLEGVGTLLEEAETHRKGSEVYHPHPRGIYNGRVSADGQSMNGEIGEHPKA